MIFLYEEITRSQPMIGKKTVDGTMQVYVAGVQVIIYIPSLLSFNSFLFLVGMANIDWTKIIGSIHGKTASKCGCSERSN